MNEYNANGERHGLWEEYLNNGLLYWKRNYVNGLFHGPYESCNRDGKICLKGIYKNHQRIGFWVDGNWNGKIRKLFYL